MLYALGLVDRRTDRKQIKPFIFYYYNLNQIKITEILFITNQLLHVSGLIGPSSGSEIIVQNGRLILGDIVPFLLNILGSCM